MRANPITVIYDGQCDFCNAWLRWLQVKLDLRAISYHNALLGEFGLTEEECAKAVYVVTADQTYSGVKAIAYLLKQRGNSRSALLIRSLGPLGSLGYTWVAAHRNSLVIRLWTKYLNRNLI
jgi:predicted DCC family thiol-disulfide oxidoreductase YuxK